MNKLKINSIDIKGIGPVTARAIVNKFGDDTLKVIEETPSRLKEVTGIGEAKAETIAKAYEEQRAFANVVVELATFDIDTKVAVKLFKEYGAAAPSIVKENPYRLIDDIYGINVLGRISYKKRKKGNR